MKFVERHNQWLYFIVFLVVGGVFILFLNNNFRKKELEARQQNLMHTHSRVVDQFSNSVDKFAGLVSGMRSFMNLSPTLPSEIEFQQFVRRQFDDIDTNASIVVSYIDSSHVFRQSFTRLEINPAGLVGKKVSSIRSQKKIEALDDLMTHDSLRMFPPLNLIEGWVGVPINFRVHRNGKTLGYVAPIIDFKSIIQEIYDSEGTDDFVFHFSTGEGYDFDRERIDNGTKIYHDNKDLDYYKNFVEDPELFQYSLSNYYGYTIKIGTAYKEPFYGNKERSLILLFWYITFALLAFIVAWQVKRSKDLNRRLLNINNRLIDRQNEIEQKNEALSSLNTTQKKFFSIIGHDLRQPLNSIEGLLFLLREEDVESPDLNKIIQDLGHSTKTTTDLLNNLLNWALSENGEMIFVPASFSITQMATEVIETMRVQASEKQIVLSSNVNEAINYFGDRDMLSTVLRNLINNALKFTGENGEVKITIEETEDHVCVFVVDNGIGMTQDEVDSLFVLDSQISTMGTAGETGTGLGLILCHSFVEKHGGTITVESELGLGSTFLVSLPV